MKRIQAWRAGLQDDRSGKAEVAAAPAAFAGDTVARAVAKKKVEDALLQEARRQLAQMEVKVASGELITREILDRAMANLTAMFVGILEEQQQTLPTQLGGDAVTSERVIRLFNNSARMRLIETAAVQLDLVDEEIAAGINAKRRRRGRPGAGAGAGGES